MSGGKEGFVEAPIMLALALPAVTIAALKKVGTSAYIQVKTAVELTELINKEKAAYQKHLSNLQNQSNINKTKYEKNLLKEIAKLKNMLLSSGKRVPSLSGNADVQLSQLLSYINNHPEVKQMPHVKEIYVSLKQAEGFEKQLAEIFQAADQIILSHTSYSQKAQQIKDLLSQKVESGNLDIKECRKLYSELHQMMHKSKEEESRIRSLKAEFNRELARVRVLYQMQNKSFIFAPFSIKNAEERIIKLKKIAAEQIAYIEEIKKNPMFNASPEDKRKVAEALSEMVFAVMKRKGYNLVSCFDLNYGRVCYYAYHGARLKVTNAYNGMLSFDVVGSADGKRSFSFEDRRVVMNAMKHFKKEFPSINAEMKKRKIEFTLVDSYEPEGKYISFESTEAVTQEEQAAILIMQNASEKYLYADGN